MVSDALTYLCMTDLEFSRQRAFLFLDEVRNRFISTYGDRGRTALAFAMNADFERVLQSLMDRFNAMRDDSKVHQVREKVQGVKDVMIENIDKVLERGERIELLVKQSEELDEHALKFRSNARTLKRKMWWKNAKVCIVIMLVLAIVIYAILAVACGGLDLKKC
jgi:vesicle-associated membrane protein 7